MDRDKADASIQARVSRKTLATIAMYLYDKGWPVRTKSELVRMAIEGFKKVIVSRGAREVLSSLEATRALERAGLGNLNVRGDRKFLEQLQLESDEGEDIVFSELLANPYEHTKRIITKRDEEIQAELDEAVKHLQHNMSVEEIKRTLDTVPEGLVVTEEE
uniref:Uncharacterized protein n=1 Tax=viral metagenome TaxID=1070528 RepID=A0A6M3JZM4_9ZZZZ